MSRTKKIVPAVVAAGAAGFLLMPSAHADLGDRVAGTMPQGWTTVFQGGSGGVIEVSASFYRLPANSTSYVALYAHYGCDGQVFQSAPIVADKTGHLAVTSQINKPAAIPNVGNISSVGLVAANGTLRACDVQPVISQG